MIVFNSEEIDFKLENEHKIKKWITLVLDKENFNLGEVNFIFCSDAYLNKINIEFLNHEHYTDIISFDYSERNDISGDIFISIERVRENSKKFDVRFEEELCRVIIHGILHFMGYKDKSEDEKKIMRYKEDYYLDFFF